MKIIGSENGLLSRLLMLGGFGIVSASAFRWTFVWIDYSNALFGIMIGLGIAFAGWTIGMMKAMNNRLSKHHRRLEFMGAEITGNAKEANLESALYDEDDDE